MSLGQGGERTQCVVLGLESWRKRCASVNEHSAKKVELMREKDESTVFMLKEKYLQGKAREKAQSNKVKGTSYQSSGICSNPTGPPAKLHKMNQPPQSSINPMQIQPYCTGRPSRPHVNRHAPAPGIVRPTFNHAQAQQWEAPLDQATRDLISGLNMETGRFETVDADTMHAILAEAEGQTPPAPATPESHTSNGNSASSVLKSLASRQHPPDPAHPCHTNSPSSSTQHSASSAQHSTSSAQQVLLPPSYPQQQPQQMSNIIHPTTVNTNSSESSQLQSQLGGPPSWQGGLLMPQNQMFYPAQPAFRPGFGPSFMPQAMQHPWSFQHQHINFNMQMRSQNMFHQQSTQNNHF